MNQIIESWKTYQYVEDTPHQIIKQYFINKIKQNKRNFKNRRNERNNRMK